MVCPMTELGVWYNSCTRSWLFQLHDYQLPTALTSWLHTVGITNWDTLSLMPIQLHSIVYSLFGSLIGPFGGFFASGVKRALKVDVETTWI